MSSIILIDDDSLVRMSIKVVLEQAGHHVREAPDGYVGLKLFQREPADVVITDLVMPEKEGIETMMELKKHDSKVKILVMSGKVSYLDFARQLGADRILAKPFHQDQLLLMVEELAGKSDS